MSDIVTNIWVCHRHNVKTGTLPAYFTPSKCPFYISNMCTPYGKRENLCRCDAHEVAVVDADEMVCVKADDQQSEFSQYIQVFLVEDAYAAVHISKSVDRMSLVRKQGIQETMKWEPARISWPSMENVELDDAEIFAGAIIKAVQIAKDMDEEKGVKRKK